MSATDPGNRSSAEIEADVESTRARLSGTLDELRDRASPGQLFEQVLDYARNSGGGDFANRLGQQVRDNPLPVLMIGAGIGWLMLSGRKEANGEWDEPAPMARLPAPNGGRGTVAAIVDSVSDTYGSVADSVTNAASSVAQGVRDTAHDVRDQIANGADAVTSRTGKAGRLARDQAGQLKETSRQGVDWLVREQPLLIGALGLAVGAAIGALLPPSDAENRLMGEARDAVAEQAGTALDTGYQRVKEVASEHLAEAREKLDTDGVAASAASLGDAARSMAKEARSAIDPSKPSPPFGTEAVRRAEG